MICLTAVEILGVVAATGFTGTAAIDRLSMLAVWWGQRGASLLRTRSRRASWMRSKVSAGTEPKPQGQLADQTNAIEGTRTRATLVEKYPRTNQRVVSVTSGLFLCFC